MIPWSPVAALLALSLALPPLPAGCEPEPTEPSYQFPNDHVLDRWEAEWVTCHWYSRAYSRNTTWFLVMLVTVTADEPEPWERWGSIDFRWRAEFGGHEVSDGPTERWFGRGDFPDGGQTLEFYSELPVFGHYESESREADGCHSSRA